MGSSWDLSSTAIWRGRGISVESILEHSIVFWNIAEKGAQVASWNRYLFGLGRYNCRPAQSSREPMKIQWKHILGKKKSPLLVCQVPLGDAAFTIWWAQSTGSHLVREELAHFHTLSIISGQEWNSSWKSSRGRSLLDETEEKYHVPLPCRKERRCSSNTMSSGDIILSQVWCFDTLDGTFLFTVF